MGMFFYSCCMLNLGEDIKGVEYNREIRVRRRQAFHGQSDDVQ
jgi:hypothetical protein